MRTNDETENELENRTEGVEDEEPGNKGATKSRMVPSKKVSRKPSTPVPISKGGKGKLSKAPKFKAKRPGSKVAKSGTKNRTGKSYKHLSKQAPTTAQKMRSFGGQDFPI